MFPVTFARLAGALVGDRCGLADFLAECSKELCWRTGRFGVAQVALRKKILLGICSRVAVFWEGTLGIDDRWCAADLCSLVPAGPRVPGERKQISAYIKEAMSIKAYNVRGSGVRSPYHLAVGMAAGANCGGKQVKRAALSQKCGKEAPPRKRKKVPSLLSETSCRRLAAHHMWNYFCTLRPHPIHF